MLELITKQQIVADKDSRQWRLKTNNEPLCKMAIGVNRRLYGKPKPATEAQKARMQAGVAQHTAIETGKSEHLGLADWEANNEYLNKYSEVFVHGKLFDMDVIGFIDAIYEMPDGSYNLVDYKFTGLDYKQVQQPWAYEKYMPVQVCYCKLFFDMYAKKIANAGLLYLLDNMHEVSYIDIPREQFAQQYAKAKSLSEVAKPWG